MKLTGMIVLLLGSASFSGAETALFSMTREQIKPLRTRGCYVDRLLTLLQENPSGLLVAILFGNLVVNILFFCTSAVLALEIGQQYGGWWQAMIGFGALSVVVLAGEILPKSIGVSLPGKVVQMNAPLLCGWFHLMGPVRRVLEAITKCMEPAEPHDIRFNSSELKMLVEAAHPDPTFGKQEKSIVEDIVNLPEIRVRELMVPRVKQLFFRTDASAKEVLAKAAQREIELIPVYKENEENVVGVVEIQDLFVNEDPERKLIHFVRPVRFVPETRWADAMLRDFLTEGLRIVFVVDEYGGLAGTIVLENLLETVVGGFNPMEIPSVEKLGEATYRLQGHLEVREWRSLFIGFLPDEVMRNLALDTLGGLVVSLLQRLPAPGDEVQVGNLQFTVERVGYRRIETVLLELIPNERRRKT